MSHELKDQIMFPPGTLRLENFTVITCSWHTGHPLVFVAGEATAAYLRDFVPDEQRSTTEAGAVSDHSPPHRGAAHCSETGRWDSLFQLWDQPGPWWEHKPHSTPGFQCRKFLTVIRKVTALSLILKKFLLCGGAAHPSAAISSQQQATLKSLATWNMLHASLQAVIRQSPWLLRRSSKAGFKWLVWFLCSHSPVATSSHWQG